MMLRLQVLACLALGCIADQMSSQEFANALVDCIRANSENVARTWPQWGNSCVSPTAKVDMQAIELKSTLTPIKGRYGYPSALWCHFYGLSMYEPSADDPQPNNPNSAAWYQHLLCPYKLDSCGHEELGAHGDEWWGVPSTWGNNLNPLYDGEPDRRTMSCGLCGFLSRQLGHPPYRLDFPWVNDPRHVYTATWDTHPFGAWLANDLAISGASLPDTVKNINNFRASNGEEIHGFLWQILRLRGLDWNLGNAYNMMLGGAQPDPGVDDNPGTDMFRDVCHDSWFLSVQSRDDCCHAAGHGFFYYYMDITRATKACWTDKMAGVADWITGKDLLKCRWICTTGIYHSAGNSLSLEGLKGIADKGISVEDFACMRSDAWTENDPVFARCAAGLGIQESEWRLDMVKRGDCEARGQMAQWERNQLALVKIQQKTCNPASQFADANDRCPQAFHAHFPCQDWRMDYKQCLTGWHNVCEDAQLLKNTMICNNGVDAAHI